MEILIDGAESAARIVVFLNRGWDDIRFLGYTNVDLISFSGDIHVVSVDRGI